MISKFGKCIRNIREQENDSLRQMAIKLGISAAFYQRWKLEENKFL